MPRRKRPAPPPIQNETARIALDDARDKLLIAHRALECTGHDDEAALVAMALDDLPSPGRFRVP